MGTGTYIPGCKVTAALQGSRGSRAPFRHLSWIIHRLGAKASRKPQINPVFCSAQNPNSPSIPISISHLEPASFGTLNSNPLPTFFASPLNIEAELPSGFPVLTTAFFVHPEEPKKPKVRAKRTLDYFPCQQVLRPYNLTERECDPGSIETRSRCRAGSIIVAWSSKSRDSPILSPPLHW